MFAIGNSKEIQFEILPVGDHAVKVTATDMDKCKAEAAFILRIEDPPELSAESTTDGNLEVQWTAESPLWVPYTTTDLGQPFVPLLIQPVKAGNQYSVELPVGDAPSTFFILQLQQ